jgi:Protein of unknown function (DUF1302)
MNYLSRIKSEKDSGFRIIDIIIFAILLIFLLVSSAHCAEYEVRGNLRGWARTFIGDTAEIDMAETRLKIEFLSAFSEKSAFFTRTYFVKNAEMYDDSETELITNLQEAYIDFYSDWLTIRAGRQLMTWGKADELNPTDILNSQDMTNILEDKIIRKKGLFAFKSNIVVSDFEIETIWKPEHQSFDLPPKYSRWSFFSEPYGTSSSPPPTEIIPGNGFDHTEWGIALSRTVSMFDFTLNWFDGWDNIPSPIRTIDPTNNISTVTSLIYGRTKMIGGSFAGSINSFGFWGEGAYFITKDSEGIDPDIKNPYVHLVIGSDYTFFGGAKANVQYIQEFITKIDGDNERDAEEEIFSKLGGIGLPIHQAVSIRVEAPFGFAASNSVEIFSIMDLEQYGTMIGSKFKVAVDDNLKIETGLVLFDGEYGSVFKKFEHNNNIYLKCIYSF